MNLQPRQIAKVVYEAIRAYDVTIGLAERKPWESTTDAERDAVLIKVDAYLRGAPHQAASIRPSDQIKWRMLAGIVQSFIPPAPVFVPPPPSVAEAPPLPVEVFPSPDPAEVPKETFHAPEGTLTTAEPANVTEALALADKNIAEANNAPAA